MRRTGTLLLLQAALAACVPDYDVRPSVVDEPVVLAVRGEPAEAAPGQEVSFSLLVGSPGGTVADPAASWSFCLEPTSPVDPSGPVSPACVADAGDEIGSGAAAIAALPGDACARFGPDTPPGDFRPRDPDDTGGYYQPVRVELDGAISFFGQRVRCNLANAPVEVVREYEEAYANNENPEVGMIRARIPGGDEVPLDAIPAGVELELVVGWPAESTEEYPHFDRVARRLVTRRETMSASWFATAGVLASDRTGRAEDDDGTTTSNRFTAPTEPGPVHLWVVLRDSRGGVAWSAATLEVIP